MFVKVVIIDRFIVNFSVCVKCCVSKMVIVLGVISSEIDRIMFIDFSVVMIVSVIIYSRL